jgi:hypothetical protein
VFSDEKYSCINLSNTSCGSLQDDLIEVVSDSSSLVSFFNILNGHSNFVPISTGQSNFVPLSTGSSTCVPE